ncbi:ranBP-type and C3HC4-type zinc finger-containing protein 1 isoform X2 [Octopus bimaculoides]|uniref:RanBP-type and C3HC4-type zinc finger-containing protein 1 n=2 Tax=Octopus bimaculoides TaxID=37653 RepID=A0A0L8G0Z0_OCTBM|nr:ranBP-type and C3HC4-type zinc finger-containing protein 1 isoform X2 [Octopus bimaculoides]|eukprot:XP_014785078.1 PREDICTED: ranBP-type and C3HC4-type zinc finger-containing protein 1-like isoform X2 [Octopus bimaculoides]
MVILDVFLFFLITVVAFAHVRNYFHYMFQFGVVCWRFYNQFIVFCTYLSNVARFVVGLQVNGQSHLEMKGQENEPGACILQLETAITSGDVKTSQTLVAYLARQKTSVKIELLHKEPIDTEYRFFSIKIYIEDRVSSAPPFVMKINSKTTVRELKRMVFLKHNLPVQVQRLIVSHKIPKEKDVLSKHGVKEGSSVFIYLVPANKVNLTKEQVDKERCAAAELQTLSGACLRVPAAEMSNLVGSSPVEENVSVKPGWKCSKCTYDNLPMRPGCEMCTEPRPVDYEVPDNYSMSSVEKYWKKQEEDAEQVQREIENQHKIEREKHKQQLIDASKKSLVSNPEQFNCPVCFDDIPPGDGIILQGCLHMFCKQCLNDAVYHNDSGDARCLFQNEEYKCDAKIPERVIKSLVSDEVYKRYLYLGIQRAESTINNSFHCKTPNCRGWCIYEDDVNFFPCPVCQHTNCLTCKSIHEGKNCKEFQDDLNRASRQNANAERTKIYLTNLLKSGDAMKCPQCEVIVTKKDGCDWLRCSVCKLEICWATRGPRWGPKGQNDNSGGCKCKVNGVKCHPKCMNCH